MLFFEIMKKFFLIKIHDKNSIYSYLGAIKRIHYDIIKESDDYNDLYKLCQKLNFDVKFKRAFHLILKAFGIHLKNEEKSLYMVIDRTKNHLI